VFVEGEIPKTETFNIDHIGAHRACWKRLGVQMSVGKESLIAEEHKPFETHTDVPNMEGPGAPEGTDAKISVHFARRRDNSHVLRSSVVS
jgi:hypothetical protein